MLPTFVHSSKIFHEVEPLFKDYLKNKIEVGFKEGVALGLASSTWKLYERGIGFRKKWS